MTPEHAKEMMESIGYFAISVSFSALILTISWVVAQSFLNHQEDRKQEKINSEKTRRFYETLAEKKNNDNPKRI